MNLEFSRKFMSIHKQWRIRLTKRSSCSCNTFSLLMAIFLITFLAGLGLRIFRILFSLVCSRLGLCFSLFLLPFLFFKRLLFFSSCFLDLDWGCDWLVAVLSKHHSEEQCLWYVEWLGNGVQCDKWQDNDKNQHEVQEVKKINSTTAQHSLTA